MENLVARQGPVYAGPVREDWYESFGNLAPRAANPRQEPDVQPQRDAGPTRDAGPSRDAVAAPATHGIGDGYPAGEGESGGDSSGPSTVSSTRRRPPRSRSTVAAQASRDLIADFLKLGWSMRQIAISARISRSAVQQIHTGQSLRVTPRTEQSLAKLADTTTTRTLGALVVDAAPSRKMIGELIEGGWSMRQIALVAQVSRSSVRSIRAGDSRRVHVKTERALREVIETLYGIRTPHLEEKACTPRTSSDGPALGGVQAPRTGRQSVVTVVRARRPLDDRI